MPESENRPTEPHVVTLRGERYLLYVAGQKRGQADALRDAAHAVDQAAEHYDQIGQKQGALDSDALDLMRKLSIQLGDQARTCMGQSAGALGHALAAFNAVHPTPPPLPRRDAIPPPAQIPYSSRHRWRRIVQAVKGAW